MPKPDILAKVMAVVREGTAVRHVAGFIDADADPHRLYLTLDLDHYVTLPAEYLAGTDDQGVSDVWVPADLPLTVTPVSAPGDAVLMAAAADAAFPLPAPGHDDTCPHCGTDLLALSRCPNPRTSHTLGWCAEA